METWDVLLWAGSIVVAAAGAWITARITSKPAQKATDLQQWVELTRSLQGEIERVTSKNTRIEQRNEDLEQEIEKLEQNYAKLNLTNKSLVGRIHADADERQKLEQKWTDVTYNLEQQLSAERILNATFARECEQSRLLTDHYAQTNARLKHLLRQKCGMDNGAIDRYLSEFE